MSTEHQYVRDRADPSRTGRIVDIDGLVDGLPTPETRFKIEWDATWERVDTFELSPDAEFWPGKDESRDLVDNQPDGTAIPFTRTFIVTSDPVRFVDTANGQPYQVTGEVSLPPEEQP